jgi:hypothetical protein
MYTQMPHPWFQCKCWHTCTHTLTYTHMHPNTCVLLPWFQGDWWFWLLNLFVTIQPTHSAPFLLSLDPSVFIIWRAMQAFISAATSHPLKFYRCHCSAYFAGLLIFSVHYHHFYCMCVPILGFELTALGLLDRQFTSWDTNTQPLFALVSFFFSLSFILLPMAILGFHAFCPGPSLDYTSPV